MPPYRLLPALLLTIILAVALPARAQLWSIDQIGKDPASFWSGMATGIAAHELAHIAVASSKGYDVAIDNFVIVYPNATMSDHDSLQVSAAGFQAQWVVSEAVLRAHERRGKTMKNYAAGVVCSHVAITLAYQAALRRHSRSDVTSIARDTGLSKDQVCLLIAVPAALDYWRLTGRNVPAWVSDVAITTKGIGLCATW